MADKRIRQRWRFEGNVQGVGFRVSTMAISARYDVVGFVRNNADGTVTVEAEGPSATLNSFLSEIKFQLATRIENCVKQEIATLTASDAEAAFVIC
ncbi:MAG: acylphosphatase [Rubripirellula sp.]|nr:acylphosphatase [Rubripirellula sp.]